MRLFLFCLVGSNGFIQHGIQVAYNYEEARTEVLKTYPKGTNLQLTDVTLDVIKMYPKLIKVNNG